MTLETLNFWKANSMTCLIITFSFSLLVGCKSYKSTQELDSIFISTELKDLETIRTFFIKDIMDLNDHNFQYKFRHEMQRLESSGFASLKSKKIEKLLQSIPESMFNDIWQTKTQSTSRRYKVGYEYLAPKEEGRYLQFVAKNTDHNPRIKEYYNKILTSGEFNHFPIIGYLNDDSLDFDLNNTNVQIVLAIHYISIFHNNSITSNLMN